MATSTELLRAAEHMRKRAVTTSDRVLSRAFVDSAEMLEVEAERLQSPTGAEIVIQIDGVRVVQPRPKRSWPEGWPPFAVLRRAYESLGALDVTSSQWLEEHGCSARREWVDAVRREWAEFLRFSNPSSP